MLSLPTSLLARILIGATVVTVPTAGVVTYAHLHAAPAQPAPNREGAAQSDRAHPPAPAAATSSPTTPAVTPTQAPSQAPTQEPAPASEMSPGAPAKPTRSIPPAKPTDPPLSTLPTPRRSQPAPVTTSPTPEVHRPAPPSATPPPPVASPVVVPPPVVEPPVVEPPAPSALAFSAAAVPEDVRDRLAGYANSGLLAYDGADTFSPVQNLSRQDFAVVLANVLALDRPATVTGSFSDVPTDAYAGQAIDAMVKAGLINAMDDSRFAPTYAVHRSDLAILLAKGLHLPPQDPATATFADVPTTHYAYVAVESVTAAGLMSGIGNGTFGPDANVTREQLALTLVRALGLPLDGTSTSPFVDVAGDLASLSAAAVVNAGLLQPVDATHFDPNGTVSRATAAVVFTKSFDLPVATTASSSFDDVPSKYYAGQAIEAAVDAGLMQPVSSTLFGPAAVLTLPQESTLFTDAMQFAAGPLAPVTTP